VRRNILWVIAGILVTTLVLTVFGPSQVFAKTLDTTPISMNISDAPGKNLPPPAKTTVPPTKPTQNKPSTVNTSAPPTPPKPTLTITPAAKPTKTPTVKPTKTPTAKPTKAKPSK